MNSHFRQGTTLHVQAQVLRSENTNGLDKALCNICFIGLPEPVKTVCNDLQSVICWKKKSWGNGELPFVNKSLVS